MKVAFHLRNTTQWSIDLLVFESRGHYNTYVDFVIVDYIAGQNMHIRLTVEELERLVNTLVPMLEALKGGKSGGKEAKPHE